MKELTRHFLTLLGISLLLLGLLLFLTLPVKGGVHVESKPLPILMYHNVAGAGEECNSVTVTSERLEADLNWLRKNGYRTILPSELANEEDLPANAVLLVFDDGYISNFELLFPLLQKYQMKAAVSLIVSLSEGDAVGHLTWDMCREMAQSGLVEFGSHTYALHNPESNGNFNADGANGVQRRSGEKKADFEARVFGDLEKSRIRIEEELGQAPVFFAYPYGVVEPDAEEYLRQNFQMTFITGGKTADISKTMYRLPRISVTMETELKDLLPHTATEES